MQIQNLKTRSVPVHDFSMNPSPEIKRSAFPVRQGNTTAFSFGYLIPLFMYDVLPGDHWNCKITAACRTAVPIAPILDNWHLDFSVFYTPYRIIWSNFVKMMGEQDAPGDSIDYTVPQIVSPVGGFAVNSIYDYMGLPTEGQVGAGNTVSISALPIRAYGKIFNDWFRDENLQVPFTVAMGDGPDPYSNINITHRGKRPDYFTTGLPWPQKGNTAATVPIGTTAPVQVINTIATGNSVRLNVQGTTTARQIVSQAAGTGTTWGALSAGGQPVEVVADLSTATAATINQLRTSISIQQLLERDARGGTRYKEMVYSHFRVISPDARLNRPEYIGGGRIPIVVNAVPQTSATDLDGGNTPLGQLGATGYALGTAGFSYAATEHGCIIVLAQARADLRYFQGIPRFWSKQTRYDFYLPVLDGLGEQAIENREIFADGSANDDGVFAYGPRWDEYRHFPSKITGIMRPTTTGNIGYWHSAQQFSSLPTLNDSFVRDRSDQVVERNFAAGSLTQGQQVFGDFVVQGQVARSMSTYGVPGLERL